MGYIGKIGNYFQGLRWLVNIGEILCLLMILYVVVFGINGLLHRHCLIPDLDFLNC